MSAQKDEKVVFFAYKINSLSDINATMCTFSVDMEVRYTWTDPKLIGRQNGETILYEEEKGLFDPDIQITNKHDLSVLESVTKITDSSTGEVKRSVQIKGTLLMLSMDWKSFPFDSQNLQGLDEFLMVGKPWKLLRHCLTIQGAYPSSLKTEISYSSTAIINIMVERRSHWLVMLAFVPTLLLMLFSWLTFVFAEDSRGGRIDVSMAALVASLSHKYLVLREVPKGDCRTIMECYLDSFFLLQVISILAHVAIRTLGAIHAAWMHWTVVGLEIILALIVYEWLFARLSNHHSDIQDWMQSAEDANQLNASSDEQNKSSSESSLPFREPKIAKADHTKHPADRRRRISMLSRVFRLLSIKAWDGFDDGITENSFPYFGISHQYVTDKAKETHRSIRMQQLKVAKLIGDTVTMRDAAACIIQKRWLQSFHGYRSSNMHDFGFTADEDLDYVIVEANSNLTEDSFDVSFSVLDPQQQLLVSDNDHFSDATGCEGDDDQDCSNITEDMFLPILRRSRGESSCDGDSTATSAVVSVSAAAAVADWAGDRCTPLSSGCYSTSSTDDSEVDLQADGIIMNSDTDCRVQDSDLDGIAYYMNATPSRSVPLSDDGSEAAFSTTHCTNSDEHTITTFTSASLPKSAPSCSPPSQIRQSPTTARTPEETSQEIAPTPTASRDAADLRGDRKMAMALAATKQYFKASNRPPAAPVASGAIAVADRKSGTAHGSDHGNCANTHDRRIHAQFQSILVEPAATSYQVLTPVAAPGTRTPSANVAADLVADPATSQRTILEPTNKILSMPIADNADVIAQQAALVDPWCAVPLSSSSNNRKTNFQSVQREANYEATTSTAHPPHAQSVTPLSSPAIELSAASPKPPEPSRAHMPDTGDTHLPRRQQNSVDESRLRKSGQNAIGNGTNTSASATGTQGGAVSRNTSPEPSHSPNVSSSHLTPTYIMNSFSPGSSGLTGEHGSSPPTEALSHTNRHATGTAASKSTGVATPSTEQQPHDVATITTPPPATRPATTSSRPPPDATKPLGRRGQLQEGVSGSPVAAHKYATSPVLTSPGFTSPDFTTTTTSSSRRPLRRNDSMESQSSVASGAGRTPRSYAGSYAGSHAGSTRSHVSVESLGRTPTSQEKGKSCMIGDVDLEKAVKVLNPFSWFN